MAGTTRREQNTDNEFSCPGRRGSPYGPAPLPPGPPPILFLWRITSTSPRRTAITVIAIRNTCRGRGEASASGRKRFDGGVPATVTRSPSPLFAARSESTESSQLILLIKINQKKEGCFVSRCERGFYSVFELPIFFPSLASSLLSFLFFLPFTSSSALSHPD